MKILPATALAHPNIAFIKYWGNKDDALRLPVNGSISMNLDGPQAVTTVHFDPALSSDHFFLNQQEQSGPSLERVTAFLDIVRAMAGINLSALVRSANNFPIGAGIASSAAAFAALSLAASRAAGLELDQPSLSALARRGSGSACRSIPAGFAEWLPGTSDQDSYAVSIALPHAWDLVDCIAILETGHKKVGSSEGHGFAPTSPLQSVRVTDAPRRLGICRDAILKRDFSTFAEIVELDSNLMHAVMMTSRPPLFYWTPVSLELIKTIPQWRAAGLPVCYTLDAGPNVHVLCLADAASQVQEILAGIQGVKQVITARPGGAARLVDETYQP